VAHFTATESDLLHRTPAPRVTAATRTHDPTN